MDIKLKDDNKHGKFYIEIDNKELAEMTFTWAGDQRFIIDHTAVDDELKGQGAGKKMVLKAVAYARENNVKIIPLCPFAKSVFNKLPEIRDVL